MGNETSRSLVEQNSAIRSPARHERRRNASIRRIKGKTVLDPSILPFDTRLVVAPSTSTSASHAASTQPPPPTTSPPVPPLILPQIPTTNNDNNEFGSAPAACATERGSDDVTDTTPPRSTTKITVPPSRSRLSSTSSSKKKHTHMIVTNSSFTTQRRHSQRAISTLSSHTTDSNWTWAGDLFSHIDPTTSSTITTITDYSTISKHSMFCQDWPACDKQLVRSAAEAMAMPMSSTTTTKEPPPYSNTNNANATTITTSTATSSPGNTSTPSLTTNTTTTTASSLASNNDTNHYSLHQKQQQQYQALLASLQSLVSSSLPSSSPSSSTALSISRLLDDLFSLAASIEIDQDRHTIYQLALSLCDTSTAARVWTARCQLDGWGTEPLPRLGFSTLLTMAEEGHWEAYYPLALCYSEGVPKHDQQRHQQQQQQQHRQQQQRPSSSSLSSLFPSHVGSAMATPSPAPSPVPPTPLSSQLANDRPLSNAISEISSSSTSSSNNSSLLSHESSCSSFDSVHIQSINKEQAWRWLHMAAQLDPESPERLISKARAQYKIGTIYFSGDALISPDHDKAFHWFTQSADNGNKYAQFIVGFHYEQGNFIQKDLSMAKKYYLSSAQQGFPDAQTALGILLIEQKQSEQGMTWLKEAAMTKNPRALVKLGTMYEYGQDVQKDETRALSYFKKAAEQHDPAAHYVLGLHYRSGTLGLPQHYIQAGRHFTKSAKSGFTPAQRLLGLMYWQGMLFGAMSSDASRHRGNIRDNGNADEADGDGDADDHLRRKSDKAAFIWFRRAASQGDVLALGLVGACYQYGRGMAINHDVALEYYRKAARIESPFRGVAQIALASLLHEMGRHRDAIEWFTKACDAEPLHQLEHNGNEMGNPVLLSKQSPSRTARLMLARYYLHGWPGVVKDGQKAFTMLTALAKESQHDAHAHYWLGACYEEGIEGTCPCNQKLAFDHYLISAKAGDTDAEFQVALMLSNGQGIPRDRKEAYHWYKKAADKEHKIALYSLGLYHAKGLEGKPKDLLRARICFEKAARLGVAPAMTSFATLCRVASLQSGPQQQEQREQAIYWYQKAAAVGDVVAQRELGLIYDAGLGVTRNYDIAFHYFQEASSRQDAQATLLLGSYYQHGMSVEKDLEKAIELYLKADHLGASVASFAAAQLYHSMNQFEDAYHYYKKAADDTRLVHNRIGRTSKLMVARYILSYVPHESDTDITSTEHFTKEDAFQTLFALATDNHFEPAFYWLADCYRTGNGVEKDLIKSLSWYHKAADELKDTEAMIKLASVYEDLGDNNARVFHYYQLAADLGHAAGQHQLGMIYWRGTLDIPINLGDAVVWFTRSAAQKHAASHWALGQMALENGDQDVAIEWWRRSIDLGYAPAMRALASLLLQNTQHAENGDQHSEDLDRAMELLTEAVEKGDAESLAYLGQLHQVKAVHSANSPAIQQQAGSNDVSHVSLREQQQRQRHNHTQPMNVADSSSSASSCSASSSHDNGHQDKVFSNVTDTSTADNYQRYNTAVDMNVGDNHSQVDDMDDEEHVADLQLQHQLQEQGLATRCFEQAAEMGHVESMFLAAESWHSQQQYAAALEYYDRAAKNGHLLARVMRARYRLAGLGGMTLDPSLGYQELLECAVKNQCVDAYNSLGQCNELGLGTSQNDQAALDWYLRSAEQTQDSEAMFRIGQLYAQGRVPPPDGQHKDVEALQWYRFASETRNHTQAHYQIGKYLLRGIPSSSASTESSSSSSSSSSSTHPDSDTPMVLIPADREAARFHFQHASELGDMNSMYELGKLLLSDTEESSAKLSSSSTSSSRLVLTMEDRRHGLDWLLSAAQMNQRDALLELGKMYHSGKSYNDLSLAEKDPVLAYDYFMRAANQGDKTAMLFVGIYYEHGIHVPLDFLLARQWYEMAARSGWWLAELAMAQLLHQDVDSREEAYRYFTLAHQHAPPSQRQPATIMLARYHLRGWGSVPVQLEQAAKQLITIAEEEHQVKVYLEVAQCYEFGIGVDQDANQAFAWYEKVFEHHHDKHGLDEEDQEDLAEAMFRLAEFYRRGWAVTMNLEKANVLYHLAAQQGSKEAQDYLSQQPSSSSVSSSSSHRY